MDPKDDPRRSTDADPGRRESIIQRLLQRHRASQGGYDNPVQGMEDIPLKDFTERKASVSHQHSDRERTGSGAAPTSVESDGAKKGKKLLGLEAVKERWKKAGNVARFAQRLQQRTETQRENAMSASLGDTGPQERRRDRSHKHDDSHHIPKGFLFGDKNTQSGVPGMDDNPEEDINDIVDKDDHRIEDFVSDYLVGHVVNSMQFRVMIFFLIILNSLLIGLQTDQEIAVKWRYLFIIFDQTVMAIFICEILMKWHYGFWIFWKDGWNILDFLIIIGMVLAPEVEFLSGNVNLRILRVFRAFRSLRSIGALAGLSMVAQTIICSIPDMANIGMLLMIIILVFGVMGTTLFASMLPKRFADLPTAMFALFVCVTQDGWVEIYQEFRENGTTAHIGGSIYLFFWIMVGAFVFANLVVAVVVTNLERAMKEFAEEQNAQNALADQSGRAHEGEHFPAGSGDKANVIEYREKIGQHVDVLQQTPFELTTLRGLNLEKLEKYLLLLTVFEENLVEYQQLRNDLCQVYDVVRTLNSVMEEDIYTQAEMEGEPVSKTIPGVDFTKGDIMSNLMKIQDKTMFSDKFQQYW